MLDAEQAGRMVMPFTTLVDQVRQEILAIGDATKALREIERRFAHMHNEAWDRERHIAGLQDRIARAEMEHAEEVKKLKAEIERAAKPVIGVQEPSGPKWATLQELGLPPPEAPRPIYEWPAMDMAAVLRRLAVLEVRIGGAEDRLGTLGARVRLIDERLSPANTGEET